MKLKKKFTTLIISSNSTRQIAGSETKATTAQRSRAPRDALRAQLGKITIAARDIAAAIKVSCRTSSMELKASAMLTFQLWESAVDSWKYAVAWWAAVVAASGIHPAPPSICVKAASGS